MKKLFTLVFSVLVAAMVFTSCKPQPNEPQFGPAETLYVDYAMNYCDWYNANTTFFYVTLDDESKSDGNNGREYTLQFFAPANVTFPPAGEYPFTDSQTAMNALIGTVSDNGEIVMGSSYVEYVRGVADIDTRELITDGKIIIEEGTECRVIRFQATVDGAMKYFEAIIPDSKWKVEQW